jgi:hypothetical protein
MLSAINGVPKTVPSWVAENRSMESHHTSARICTLAEYSRHGIRAVFVPANSKNYYFRLFLIVKITANTIFALDDG